MEPFWRRGVPTLTIKGIPEPLYRRLKQRAQAHRRSLNGEIIMTLEQATNLPTIDPRTWLVEADRLRARLDLPPLTEARLRRRKAAGRP
jgi:plasmid stability protein